MKVFISHSSVQKLFVREVANILGHNVAIVDEYTFESGHELWNDIRVCIESSDIFVYFISHEALDSEWVNKEISFVRDLEDKGRCTVLPFVIDNTDVSNPSIPYWIKRKILNQCKSPNFVARKIRAALNNLLKKRNELPVLHGEFFEGRDEDMKRVREQLNMDLSGELRAIVVSGMAYAGRKRFLREIINLHLREPSDLSYEPIIINLGEDEGLAYIVGFLNDEAHCYSKQELLEKQTSKEGLREAAVQLFNTVMKARERVVIDDGGNIVLRNGRLVDWFEDLLAADGLSPQTHFFVAAKHDASLEVKRKYAKILLFHKIDHLDKAAMASLLNAYIKRTNIELSLDDRDSFLKVSKGYPDVLLEILDVLKVEGLVSAKKFAAEHAGKKHTDEIKKIINQFKDKELHFALIVFLSKFDFISYTNLLQIFGEKEEDVVNALNEFRSIGILEYFGKGGQYMRLSYPVHDSITRNKDIQLPAKYKSRLHKGLKTFVAAIESDNDMPTDFSAMLAGIKEMLTGRTISRMLDKVLIPSFVLKVIIEKYNSGGYEEAYNLARKVLYDYHLNDYDSVIEPIRYWMCLAMCRLNKMEVLDEAATLNHYKCHFIRGFYYSCLKKPNYNRAITEYKKALETTGYLDNTDRVKAKHQLVIALQNTNRHKDAVDLSRDCYNSDSSNPYYIHAYFESVLKSNSPDPNILNSLIKDMEELGDNSAPGLIAGMQAQVSYYAYSDYPTAKNTLNCALAECVNTKERNGLFRIYHDLATKNNDIAAYNAEVKKYGAE